MKKGMLLLLLATCTISCNAQYNQNEKQQKQITVDANKPKISWKVNKKYDDKGNLIGYDSSYTWTYSAKGGKVHSIEADSVMAAFKKQFNAEFPSFFNKDFGNPVWSDSLFYKDFIAPDYFMKKWEEHSFDMEKMMKQMDSMRNSFLKHNYPGLSTQKT
jgi:hypothetical protein